MKLHYLLAIPLLSCSLLQAEEITKGSLRTSFESVTISPTEEMGLFGVSYLFEPNKNFYYGTTVYGTLTGERGGFFVGGLNGGAKYALYKNLYLDGGVFVGGGGGGSAPQGGGLMLKAYGGLLYEFSQGYSLGVDYSYVTFPNGGIDSKQLAFVADAKFETLFLHSNLDKGLLKKFSFENKQDYLTATLQLYVPNNGTKKRSGAPLVENIQLLGIEYGMNISKSVVAYIESAGALGGDSTGYMEVLGGVGYSHELLRDLNFDAKFSLGSAGGGEVDTGGGAVTKASLGLHYDVSDSFRVATDAGVYHAFEGGFDASFLKAELGINTHFLSLSTKSSNNYSFESLGTQKFHIRLVNQTYFYDETLRAESNGENVDLLGAKLDWFMSENFYVSGQGFAAYRGGAGGYATGTFGCGYILPLVYDVSLVFEVDAGAAGGGGLQTGSGAIVQGYGGIMYALNRDFSLELLYGKTEAIDGPLDVKTLELTLVYRFDKLVLK